MPLFGWWMWKKIHNHTCGVVDQGRGHTGKGWLCIEQVLFQGPFCRCAPFPCSHYQHATTPFVLLYMLAAPLKPSCPKWHGFCPSPDGSISQDSEKANWNILLASSIQVSQPFKAGWGFREQQIYPAPRRQSYYFLMGFWRVGGGCQRGLYIG